MAIEVYHLFIEIAARLPVTKLFVGGLHNAASEIDITTIQKAFNSKDVKITPIENMYAYYLYHVAEVMPYGYMCYKVNGNLKKLKRRDIKTIMLATKECLETIRDLRQNNAQDSYYQEVKDKIHTLEKRKLWSELGTGVFVCNAEMILKFGIATTALVGAMLLKSGQLGVSFTAKQGEITALVGPSGSGKTTASRLAARFWDIDSGKITVGGQDISKVDPEKLMGIYSIVFQDVTLFNNTIMENIRIGDKNATDDQVKQAAALANCTEFIEQLPDKWDTIIGENGKKLSGGERQRISIARAFLKNAPIILLDEASASLDVENETLIQQSISKLIKGKTVLIIAHRLRTIAGADKIITIKDGKAHVEMKG